MPSARQTGASSFRIGINLGDIIIEEGDIHGDGVNIAARLEALAEPGGICISSPCATRSATSSISCFEDLGEPSLKNIARPVRVFRVRPRRADGHGRPIRRCRSPTSRRSRCCRSRT